jgi:asparagine synthase (glutamine-hydrolysing)
MIPYIFGLVNNLSLNCKVSNLGKFYNDEIFYEDSECKIVLKGVIFNKKDLEGSNHCTLRDLFRDSILRNNELDVIPKLRGNFSGIFYNKRQQRGIIFTDQFGNEPLYYNKSANGSELVFASTVSLIANYLKSRGEQVNLSISGAYELLTYAYMYHNGTLFRNIFRLLPGQYILFSKQDDFIVDFYHIIDNTSVADITEEEAISRFNELFLNAVTLQKNKNDEYGFPNVAPLSGGLDSRMTCYALKEIGAENVITFTYSQTGQFDNVLPAQISQELGYTWLFKALDNGLDMVDDITDSIKLADNVIYYYWPAQLNGFLKLINTDTLGIVHTGVIGDVVLGSFQKSIEQKKYSIGDGAYSKKLIDELLKSVIEKVPYANYEIGMLYNRALNGANMGYVSSFRQYCEAASPFMNVDVFDFCMSLPLSYRVSHNIYYKWVKKYYPSACKYSHNGLPIRTSDHYINYKDRMIPINGILDRMYVHARQGLKRDIGMNPTDKWLSENKEISVKLKQYFNESIDSLNGYPELKDNTIKLFDSGSAIEKMLAISLTGSCKQQIIEEGSDPLDRDSDTTDNLISRD